MPTQFFPLLPKRKDASAVNPDKVGRWEDDSYNFLPALINSLASTGKIQDLDHIDSIPDVWARPLLFQMALFDDSEFVSGLHERAVNEWRALLAMLALKDIRHFLQRHPFASDALHIVFPVELDSDGLRSEKHLHNGSV